MTPESIDVSVSRIVIIVQSLLIFNLNVNLNSFLSLLFNYLGLLFNIVTKTIVGSVHNDVSKTNGQGEEDLGDSSIPNLWPNTKKIINSN